MRFATLATVFALLAAPALAQTPSTTMPNATPAPSTSAPAASDNNSLSSTNGASSSTGGTSSTGAHSSSHASLDKRFKDANTTNDGHLTKEQAESAGNLKSVARHFDAIDADHKGYVTIEDIHKYNHDRRAARHAARSQKTEN